MAAQKIRFDDGAAYERMMGIWSRGVGEDFLDWLNLPKGLKCVDVGCGNGAFTELLVERCRPVEVQGILRPNKLHLPARDTPRKSRSFVKPMPWHSHSPIVGLMPPPWRWSFFSFRNQPKVLPRWTARCVGEVPSPPMRGTCWAEDFL